MAVETETGNGQPPDWREDKNGKQYIPRLEGKGILYRQGDTETVLEALERDSRPKDQRPRRSKTARKPPAPAARADLGDLEAQLAMALKAPAIPCATFGDAWAADHFTNSGPALARNLVVASEHNPWLRARLEAAASGEDMMMAMVSMIGVAGAVVMYILPPMVWWFNLPIPDKGREMFGIPERREHAAPAAPPASAEAA